METKKCICCGRELPVSAFRRAFKSADGFANTCRECKSGGADNNAPLSKFQPRELIEELRKRGYTGELKYIQIIKV